ncbi:MAG: MBOAT family protein [Candidatus Promineofilum sp.]|nr:MBOAT family protein [Promineifilum sp.]MCW5862337.1 MBOAT family protein [Anaerolineae bacterium]
MIFSSFQFLAFLLVVMALLIVVPGQRWRKLTLILASYYFYAYWDWRFLILLLLNTVVNAFLGKAMYTATDARRKKSILIASLVFNLGVLAFFKYFNFFIDSADYILSPLGFHLETVSIILPVGISFFTFESISYVIDIFRGTTKPAESFSDYALFVAFFPRLVAGPIVRPADYLPQLKKPIGIRGDNVWAGAQIFTVGLFKKLILADSVAPFVNQVFADPSYYSGATVWLAVFAYAIQIYCDFSGYSDMAIGIARMLGFHLNRNFHMPYISTSVAEFWNRWHISLSTWLRDYLYIPLGGNRKGSRRTYLNLMITMLLGGLWHGASWNFVIWGGVHGGALGVNRYWERVVKMKATPIGRVLAWAATFLFVCVVWVLFRAPNTATMLAMYSKMLFINADGVQWYYQWFFVAALLMVVGHLIGIYRDRAGAKELVFFDSPYSFKAAFAMSAVLLLIYLFAPTNTNPFIYFQF